MPSKNLLNSQILLSFQAMLFQEYQNEKTKEKEHMIPTNLIFSREFGGRFKEYFDRDRAYHCYSQINGSSGERWPLISLNIVPNTESKVLFPDNSTLSELVYYANYDLLPEALAILDAMFNISFVPDAHVVSHLIYLCGSVREFDTITTILRQMQLKDIDMLPDIFAMSIS